MVSVKGLAHWVKSNIRIRRFGIAARHQQLSCVKNTRIVFLFVFFGTREKLPGFARQN